MALGSTQPLTEMITRNISYGAKGGRCVGLTTLPPHVLIVLKYGSLNLLEPLESVQVSNGMAFTNTTWSDLGSNLGPSVAGLRITA